MSLSSSLAELYRRLGYQSSPAADVTTRLTAFLNEAQQDVIGEIGGRRLVEGRITFASVASQPEYGLPPSIVRVLSLRDTANNRRLQEVPESTYRTMLPNPTASTGTPYAYSTLGLGAFANRPSVADKIYAVSSAAGDTTQKVYWEFVTTGGAIVSGNTTLTGTTALQLGTSASVVDITDIYLDVVCTGTVTFTQTNGAGATLSTINIGALRSRYQKIALVTTPSGALTYTVDCEVDATDLVQATDDFPIPSRFSRVVVARARTYEYEKMGDQVRYAMAMGEYRRELGKLNHYLISGPDQMTIPGSGIQSPSVLPGNWPWDGYGVR